MSTDEIKPHSLIRRRAGVPSECVDDAVVISSSATGAYYGLEAIGLRIWQLLAEPRTFESLASELGREYDVDPATCAQDVREFLADLGSEGLLEFD